MNVNVKLAETDPFKNCVDFMFTVSSIELKNWYGVYAALLLSADWLSFVWQVKIEVIFNKNKNIFDFDSSG